MRKLADDSDPLAAARRDLDRLATYRLDHGLTFDALAAEMADAGWGVEAHTLNQALSRRLQTQPRETTRHKISRFLATLDASPADNPAPRKTRRRRVAA